MIAYAQILGSDYAPNLKGKVIFRDIPGGVEVCIEVTGLPNYSEGTIETPPTGPHAFHLHVAGNCEINDPENPYTSAGNHYNPSNEPFGNQAGDFPSIFSSNGYSRMCFYTNKFSVFDILNKAVIIYQNPDNFDANCLTSVNKRIGCGVIKILSDD